MKTVKVNTSFSTDPNSEIDSISLELTNEDISRIKQCCELVTEHKLQSIKIDDVGKFTLLDSNDELVDYPTEEPTLIIYSNRFYIYLQSEYDASLQIESEGIDLRDITD